MPLLYCQAVKVGLNIMRNKSLDAGKAMAAFGVVFIHVSFPGQTGQIIKALARSAVPFFFMVSGYFCYYNRRNTGESAAYPDTSGFRGTLLFPVGKCDASGGKRSYRTVAAGDGEEGTSEGTVSV